MNYKGVIIEESLKDKTILDLVKVISTEIEQVTDEFETPWLDKWTLHTVEITEELVDDISKKISLAFDKEHPNWYADYKNDKFHYIVFANKIFKVDLNNPVLYKEVKTYGVSIGIPEYQVNFTQ